MIKLEEIYGHTYNLENKKLKLHITRITSYNFDQHLDLKSIKVF